MDEKKIIHSFEYKNPVKFSNLKLVIKNSGQLSSSHIGAGGNSWIFLDEINIGN